MTRSRKMVARGLYGLVAALLWIAGEVPAQSRFDDLISKLPGDANAIVVIDVKAVHGSPIAVRDGWAQRHEAAYVNSPLMLPPESDRVVVASEMLLDSGLRQQWELALVSLTEPLSIRSIARAEGGYVDPVSGLNAAWSPSDAYFVDLGGNQLGIMNPANRQLVMKWANSVQAQGTGLTSPYLKSMASAVTGPCQIVMALDLQNVVQPHLLRQRLLEAEWTKDDAAKRQQWEALFLSVQGVSLKVMLGETAQGRIEVTFGNDTSVLGEDAKSVFLNTLDRNGIGIDELGDWKATTRGKSVLLEGGLSDSALRKIFSLLELPSGKFSTVPEAAAEAPPSADLVAQASLAYFQSVTKLLDDLRQEFTTSRDARHTMASAFIDRYARRIDRLPILNVDEALLDFGGRLSATMRDASVASKGAGVSAGVRKSAVYGNYSYTYDSNGYYTQRSNASVQTQIGREEEAQALNVRFDTWKEIEDSLAQIRREMTAKYQLAF